MLVDSHCHLDRLNLEAYEGSLSAAIEAAKEAGVGHLLCVCISDANRRAVLEIAEANAFVSASAGVHPSDTEQASVVSVQTLIDWCQHPKIVALGETGLDYYYTRDNREQQMESFANHLLAGKELGLPVIVHTRDAREDTLDCIKQFGSAQSSGVLHCFTETWEMAKAALDLNYYISISGIVTFRNAEALRDVVRKVPLDRLLVETDSPYLAPVPFRGKPNEPRHVRTVAEFVADLRGMSFSALSEQTGENFFRLFSRAAASQTAS